MHTISKVVIQDNYCLPVADPSILNTSTVITVADGLLRISAGWTFPPPSLTS